MVPFAGYQMPVQYPEGVLQEHTQCRTNASLFDVSHMGQVKIRGKNAVDFVERLVVGDIRNKPVGEGFLSLILNEQAGIIDDTIVTQFEDHVHMVVNGANKYIDLQHMNNLREKEFAGLDVTFNHLQDRSLVALQGPQAAQALQSFTSVDLKQVGFMKHLHLQINKLDIDVLACRCGYTGEDGFEISVSNDKAVQLAELLLSSSLVKPAGLGSRDSLRLEAGLCLHGNDMDDTKNPAECTLLWTVRKDGKPYLGKLVLDAKRKNPETKRVGFVVDGNGIIRQGCDILNEQKEKVGFSSSGTFSPLLKQGIGMIFVKSENSKVGTQLFANSKGQDFPIVVTQMPFVDHRYYQI